VAEKIEFVCKGCGRKYRLRGSPEEVREDLLFCPECGGKLAPYREQALGSSSSQGISSTPRKDFLEDLLITGPVALIYWTLPASKDRVEEVLRNEGCVIKDFQAQEDLKYWLRLFIPEVVVFATEDEGRVADFEAMLLDLPMEDYRRIFRIKIASRYRTLEPTEVFLAGVHLVCNPRDLEKFEEIYQKARDYWKVLYAPYFKAYEGLGEGRIK